MIIDSYSMGGAAAIERSNPSRSGFPTVGIKFSITARNRRGDKYKLPCVGVGGGWHNNKSAAALQTIHPQTGSGQGTLFISTLLWCGCGKAQLNCWLMDDELN